MLKYAPGRWNVGAALLAVAMAAAGCVGSNKPDPSACAALSRTVEVTLSADALTPEDPAACRGQRLEFVVDSEIDGVLHVHGLEEEVPLIEVAAGESTTTSFEASRSGQFPIEVHTNESPGGISVGVLTIHEP